MDYLHYLKVERGLSENTIASYGIDLKLFLEYLRENEIPSFKQVNKEVIVNMQSRRITIKLILVFYVVLAV